MLKKKDKRKQEEEILRNRKLEFIKQKRYRYLDFSLKDFHWHISFDNDFLVAPQRKHKYHNYFCKEIIKND